MKGTDLLSATEPHSSDAHVILSYQRSLSLAGSVACQPLLSYFYGFYQLNKAVTYLNRSEFNKANEVL